MFKIEYVHVDMNAQDFVEKMIRSQEGNFKQIGSGVFGRVFGSRINKKIVYKIGEASTNTGYISYLKELSKQKKHNPFTPKIHAVRFVSGKGDTSAFIVCMERLRELPYDGEEAADTLVDLIMGEKKKQDTYNLGIRMVLPSEIKSLVRMVRKAERVSEATLDLHYGNFMVRGRQIVVTDPLA